MTPHSPEAARPGRELRLDMFRGVALVMIFINHVPGTIFEELTSRNFGFSDAAEAFVFMSGMAAGLAYTNGFRTKGPVLTTLRIWARVRHLYFVHLAMTLIAAAIFVAGAVWFDLPSLLERNNMAALFDDTVAALMGLPILSFQLGYLNILPLYIVLLFAAPLMFALALYRPIALVIASIVLWIATGALGWTLPSYPGNGGWFFDPFAWQLMFAIGLACGVAMKDGTALVPFNRILFWAATAFLVLVALWMQIPALGAAGRSVLAVLSAAGAPDYVVWFNKNTLALPRALHALALFYVLSSIPALIPASRTDWARPLVILGQHALPVFATGTLIAITLQAVKTGVEAGPMLDGLCLAGGLALQVGLAYALDGIGRGTKSSMVARTPPAPHSAQPLAAPVTHA